MLLVGRSASWAPVSISTIEELWLLSVISDTDELILSREIFLPPGPDSSEKNESPAALLLLFPLGVKRTFFCEAGGTDFEPCFRLSLDLIFLPPSASTSSLGDEAPVARVLFERRALPSLPSSAPSPDENAVRLEVSDSLSDSCMTATASSFAFRSTAVASPAGLSPSSAFFFFLLSILSSFFSSSSDLAFSTAASLDSVSSMRCFT
mmetsp:Transcript_21449/g.50621  ORF Transcript_21449/g.50621 Transcript_21449/m.50621 type:complete len:207 (+) Transcript_21449:4230-4850(+)